MKIVDSSTFFEKVKVGQVFRYENKYFMSLGMSFAGCGSIYNAICLNDGKLKDFATHDTIVVVDNVELVVH